MEKPEQFMTPDSEPTRGKGECLVFLAAESLCAKCEKAMYHNDETSFKFEPGDICNDCAQSEVIHLRTERDTFQKVVVERDAEIEKWILENNETLKLVVNLGRQIENLEAELRTLIEKGKS